jgi:hypothetical protein
MIEKNRAFFVVDGSTKALSSVRLLEKYKHNLVLEVVKIQGPYDCKTE